MYEIVSVGAGPESSARAPSNSLSSTEGILDGAPGGYAARSATESSRIAIDDVFMPSRRLCGEEIAMTGCGARDLRQQAGDSFWRNSRSPPRRTRSSHHVRPRFVVEARLGAPRWDPYTDHRRLV